MAHDFWDCVTLPAVLFLAAWLLVATLILRLVAKPFRRMNLRLMGPIIRKLNMKPCCAACEAFLPEPCPDVCPNCGRKLHN